MAARDYELLLKISADIRNAVGPLNQLSRELRTSGEKGSQAFDKVKRSLDKINRSASSLKGVLGAAFAAVGIKNLVSDVVDANVALQKIHYGLQQAFGSSQAADREFKFLAATSQRLGLNLVDAADGYKDLAASAQGTGLQSKQLQQFFVGLSEASSVLHIRSEDLNGIMIQLSQGLSLGKLQMQDLRAVAQHLPGTFSLLSQAFKENGKDLKTLLKEGGLPAVQTLEVLGKALHDRFGKEAIETSHSLQAELNRVKSSIFLLETQASKAGFLASFTQSLRELTTALKDPSIVQGFSALLTGIGNLITFTLKGIAAINGLRKAIVDAFAEDGNKSYLGMLNEYGALGDRLDTLQKKLDKLKKSGSTGGGVGARLAATPVVGGQVLVPTQNQIDNTQSTKQLQAEIDALKKHRAQLLKAIKAEREALNKSSGPKVKLPPIEAVKFPDAQDPKKAAQRAAKLKAANEQLAAAINAVSKQAQGPASKAWADYTAAVTRAKQAGAKFIAAGGNVAYVQQQVAKAVDLANQAKDNALKKLHQGLQIAVLKATGQTAEASRIEIEQKYRQMEQDLIANGDTAGAALVRKLINVEDAKAQLQQLEAEVNRIFAEQSRKEASIQAQQQAGYLTQYDAQKQIAAAHQATIDRVDKLIPKMRELAAATGDPAVIARVRDITAQVDNLKLTANQAAQSIKNSFKEGLGSAIDQLVQGTTSLGNAVRGFIRQTISSLAQLATSKYLDELFNSKGSSGSSGGGFWSTAISAVASYFGAGKAGGGVISGPGTQTSDSILTPTSRDEVVIRAASATEPGATPFLLDFNRRGMRALEAWGQRWQGFANGGLVAPSIRGRAQPAYRISQGGLAASGPGVVHQRLAFGLDPEVLDDWARSSAFEQHTKHILKRNPTFIRQILRTS